MRTNKKTFGTRTQLSTLGTGLGSEIRTDFNSLYSIPQGFVSNELLELVERPTINPKVKSFAFINISYTFEVLQNNSSCFAVINNLFTDNMVPISLETFLLSRNLFEKFLATSSAFALEPCSQSLEFEHVSFDFSPAKELPIACYSNMVYSDINTNLKSVRNLVDVDISGKCDVKKHSIMFVNSNNHSLVTPVEILPIVFRNFNWDINSTIDSCEPNLIKFESKYFLVKIKRHVFFKKWLTAFSVFNRLQSLRSNTISIYNELGRKIEFVPTFIITKMMKLVFITNIRFKTFISNVRYNFGILLHSFKKQFICRYFKFNSYYGLHIDKNVEQVFKCFYFVGEQK